MKLNELLAERDTLAAEMTALFDQTPKDDDEDEIIVSRMKEVEAKIAKVDSRITFAKKIEATMAEAAKPVAGAGAGVDFMTGGPARPGNGAQRGYARVDTKPQAWEEPGIGFARFVKCFAAAAGNSGMMADYAKAMYPDDGRLQFKAALLQNTGTAGGFLVPEQQSRELVEYLRHLAKVRPFARVVPLNGTMTMPVQSSGVSANYIGENTDDNAQDITFGQRRLTARKLRALVAISNDLIRNSSPEADTIVRDDLAGALAEAEDLSFLRGSGVGDNPKGMRYWASSVVNGTGTSSAQIEADLIGMVSRLTSAKKGQLRSPRWFMSSRSYFKLYSLRYAISSDPVSLVFPEIRNGTPMLLGFPVTVSDQIPITLGSGTVTEIYLVDMGDAIIGEEMGITIAFSSEASFKDENGVMQSAFSRDLSVLRAIAKHDFVMRRDISVEVLTGTNVTW
jgi:HK97 family phage major capsid protein